MMPVMPGEKLPSPVDAANYLLAPGPAALLTATDDDNPAIGVITIRTPTTTLTVQLPKAQVLAWGTMITDLGRSMEQGSSLLVATPNTTLIRP